VFVEYFLALPKWLPLILTLFAGSFVTGLMIRKKAIVVQEQGYKIIPPAILALVLVAGLALAWQTKSLFDDSFISFRYAENFLDGHGLVYNIGERVEGYTNFLWVMVLALLTWLTGASMPHLAFFACLFCLAGNLITVYLIGRRLNGSDSTRFYLPLAPLWLAAQYVFHVYGTTGMETMFAGWLVNLGVLFLIAKPGAAGAGLTGLFLILATFARPDHGLFYGVGGLVLLIMHLSKVVKNADPSNTRRKVFLRGVKELGMFCLPFLLYLGYTAWRYGYYGQIVPNTYFAKSAMLTRWDQGIVYAGAYGLSAHMIVLLPMFFIWLVTGKDPHRATFKRFAGLALFVYSLYIIRFGGDHMFGRFFLSVVPLVILGVEQWVHRLARQSKARLSWRAIVAVSLVFATMHGMPLFLTDTKKWHMTEPNKLHRVHRLFPLRISNANSRGNRLKLPKLLYKFLYKKGIKPVIADGGIGMIGYYSRLPLIDTNGLTDAFVAHSPLKERSMSGHEKNATGAYLDFREVRVSRGRWKGADRKYTDLSINGVLIDRHRIYRYDRKLMGRIKKESPKVTFTSFPEYLDQNIPRLLRRAPGKVARTLASFDHYYFSINNDPERRRPFVDRFIRLWDFENGIYPKNTKAKGAFVNAFVRPAFDKDFYISGYQGETLIASSKRGKGELKLPAFVITGDELGYCFAGESKKRTRVRLLINGKTVFTTRGKGDEKLRYYVWKVGSYKGNTAQLILQDNSKQSRVLFDFFWEASTRPENE